jgi:hypothetical protein
VKRIEDGSPIPEDIDPSVLEAWAEQLEQLRAAYDAALDRAADAQRRVNELTTSRDQLQGELQSVLAQIPTVTAAVESARSQMAALAPRLEEFRAARDAATARLLGTDRASGTVDTKHPLLLLPLRLETRFQAARSGRPAELRLRIYPDDVHIDTHEPGLTEEEERWGRHFWEQHGGVTAGAAPTDRQRQAWQQLVDRFSAPRAAWIARVLDPAKPIAFTRRTTAWTRASHTRVLADRWVAVGYRDDRPVVTVWGKPVPDRLVTGPTPPSQSQPAAASGVLPPVDDDMRWMLDFDSAEAKGMGIRIPLTDEQARCGFERLIVLGIKASIDAKATAARLTELLDAHHYTNGLALVAQNVATNNTADGSSGYTSNDGDAAASYAIELGGSLVRPGSDGEIAAQALGVASLLFSHVWNAGGNEQRHARTMNAALWTLDSPLKAQLAAAAGADGLRVHFADFVRARGPLAALRVGSQPYGLLPAAAVDRWVPASGNQDERSLADWWRSRRSVWRQLAARARSLRHGGTPITLLSQEANACRYVLHQTAGGAAPPAPRALDTPLLRDLLLQHVIEKVHDPVFDSLKALPDAARRPLIAEGLDLVTYRFDAWATSLASRRLADLRRASATGVRLGGYGWVEDLRPAAPLQEVSPPPANTPGPVYRSAANKGYVHAPSLTHAATAAVLRSGYLSDLGSAEGTDTPLAVDLSSDRVHRAKWLLDGVREGQPLAALLGYRFERGLHEHGLDRFIHRFRTLAGLKDDDTLQQAYDTLRKAEKLAAEVSAIYEQRDQANARALEAQALKTEREQRRQKYQNEVAAIDKLNQDATAAAKEATQLEGTIAQHQTAKPRSAVDRAGGFRVQLIEDVDLAPWNTRLQELTLARQAAQSRAASARSAFTARNPARLAALREIAALNDAANADSIPAAQQIIDVERAVAKELDRQGLAKEGGTRGAAEQALTAARRQLALELNRQWAQALESLAANNVVDGLELHRRWKAGQRRRPPQTPWDATTIPFGDTTLGFPAPGTDDFRALDAELRSLDEWVDAVGDAVVAESVFQIVQGNPLRSGATLDAIASGEMPPPELEVVRTPRTGIALTHRLLTLFPASAGIRPPAWPPSVNHVRAQAEPLLNAWAATLLPRPSQVRCTAAYVDRESGTPFHEMEVALTTLDLSPLDALYLADGRDQAQRSELEQRLAFHLLRTKPASVPADADVRLSFARQPAWTSDVVSVGEFLETARTARALIAGSRAIDGRDLSLPGASTGSGLESGELARRAQQAVDALEQAFQALRGQAERETSQVDAEKMRQALVRVAYFGVHGSIPLAPVGDSLDVRSSLLDQGRSVATEVQRRLERLSKMAAALDVTQATPEARRDHDLARLKEIFGDDFRVMPQLRAVNSGALNETFAASLALQGNDPLAAMTWFQRAAFVREGAARLDAAMMYAETIGDGASLSLTVGQLPYSATDRWVALPAVPNQTIPGGRLSLVAHMPLPAAVSFDQAVAGLLIDEWVEVVPSRRETTGLTFHYDQPNSTAPQSMLLAVPADQRTMWDLDSLAAILRETWDLARVRTAAPDSRAETVWVADDVPPGATPLGEREAWTWVRRNPRPLSGKAAHQSAVVAGMHQHHFQGATATLSISVGDRLFAYVYLDPINTPRQVMLQWNDGTWEHRAYWGGNLIPIGTDGTASRQFVGPLPPPGTWVRLEIPAALVGLEGRVVNGMAFTLFDGRATWGQAGLVSRQPADATITGRLAPALFFDGSTIDFSGVLSTQME